MSAPPSEVLDDNLLIIKEKKSVVDHKVPKVVRIKKEQKEPEPQAVKVEHIELWIFQDEERISVKQETVNPTVSPAYEEIRLSEPEPVQIKEEQEEPEPVQIKEEQKEPEPVQIKEEQKEPEPVQIKEEQEEPEPVQIKEEQEEPEPVQIKEEQEEPEPVQIKEEQEEPEPVQIKEEQHHLCSNQDEHRVFMKQEPESIMVTPTNEQKHNREQEPIRMEHLYANQPEDEIRHQRRSDQEDPKPDGEKSDLYQCNVCGKRFTWIDQLIYHFKFHTSGNLCCNICGKSFIVGKTLLIHMKTHALIQSYSCESCLKSFGRDKDLSRHLKIDVGAKPFFCRQCFKFFPSCCEFIKHMMSDPVERPYSCELCDQSFNKKHLLDVHLRTHTYKPFSCESCGKTFRYRHKLTGHIKNEHQ